MSGLCAPRHHCLRRGLPAGLTVRVALAVSHLCALSSGLDTGVDRAGGISTGPCEGTRPTIRCKRNERGLLADMGNGSGGKQPFFFPDSYGEGWRSSVADLGRVNFFLNAEQFFIEGYPGNVTSGSRAYVAYQLWTKDGDGAKRSGLAAEIAKNERVGIYKYPPGIIGRLPVRSPVLRFNSCAVVGNSGEMLRGKLGKEIDAHDIVIRLNAAPTQGFQQHVGSKATFEFINHAHFKALAKARNPSGAVSGQGHLVLFESIMYQAYYHIIEPLMVSFPPKNLDLVVVSPDFTSAAFELWRRMVELVVQEEGEDYGQKKPTSGWFAMVFGAQMCKQIDLYGFAAYTRNSSARTKARYHYFDNVAGWTDVHSFELNVKVLQKLASLGFAIRLAHPVSGISVS